MTVMRCCAALVAATALVSCGGTTGGNLLTEPFQAGGLQRNVAPDAAYTFTTPLGWTVTLTEALLATGPFYFNNTVLNTGEFRSGTVIMEVVGQIIIDALDPTLYPISYGVNGETGDAVTVEIDLFPPDQTESSTSELMTLGTANQGFIAGTATPPAWAPLTSYSTGAIVTNSGSWYVCVISGESAPSGGPSGTGTGILDGTVSWNSAAPPAWMGGTTYAVGEMVKNGGDSYVCIGKGTAATTGGPTGTGTRIHDGTVTWTYEPLPTVSFGGWLTINQSLATINNPLPYLQRIAGAACNLNFASNSQTLVFSLDPTHWFDQIDFSPFVQTPLDTTTYSVSEASDVIQDGAFTWTNGSTFHNQFFQGVLTTTGVYNFELQGP
jgi:hypothetical protein